MKWYVKNCCCLLGYVIFLKLASANSAIENPVHPKNFKSQKEKVIQIVGNLGPLSDGVSFWQAQGVSWGAGQSQYTICLAKNERIYTLAFDDLNPVKAEFNPRISFSVDESDEIKKIRIIYRLAKEVGEGEFKEVNELVRQRIARRNQIAIEEHIENLKTTLRSKKIEFTAIYE